MRQLAEPEAITHRPEMQLAQTEAPEAAAYTIMSAMTAVRTDRMAEAATVEKGRELLQESLARIPELSIVELVELQTIPTDLHQVEDPEEADMEPVDVML